MSTICNRIKMVMLMFSAFVFSIEEFSTFDGPGIRTSVFLKGCPLRCSWCHNPEGQSFNNEIMKARSGCVGCGACVKAGGGKITEQSIKVCPNNLLRLSGVKYTSEELVKKLEKNFDLLKISNGGITFSGGEPLANSGFLIECLSMLKGKIHTAVQTSGFCDEEIFKKVLELSDYFLFDIKLIDEDKHIKYTGVSNKNILNNFKLLVRSGKDFTVRTPLIPTVTDTKENLTAIAKFLKDQGVNKIELLPYNKAAGGKYAAIGKTFAPDYDENTECNKDTETFKAVGIDAVIL